MLDDHNGNAEIQRNELATTLGCVPSQINYVITSRFTPEQGYMVESRRGGGGYIRITRVHADNETLVMHLVNSIGDKIDKVTAEVMIKNLYRQQLLDRKLANVMMVALSDRALATAPAWPTYRAGSPLRPPTRARRKPPTGCTPRQPHPRPMP